MGLRPIPRLKPILRYYYAGEYGEKYRRPHYHACLFGVDFNDKKLIETTDAGFNLYESATLNKLWPHGRHKIGELNWETAAYTARYIMKKINGDRKKKHYEVTDYDTGEIITLLPEYNDMSREHGIGKQWYDKYKHDFYKQKTSAIIIRGHKTKPPRYYDKLHERDFPEHHRAIKKARLLEAALHKENHTTRRLLAEEVITTAKIKSLRQKL